MPVEIVPSSVEELAEALCDCGSRRQTVELGGAFTKRTMGGPVADSDAVLSTRGLGRVLSYEPKDLTVSVEAGTRYRELQETLQAEGQFLPLDPPLADRATVGGAIATNGSGPRRRRYGTARDLVIGMKMITIEGKTVESGGMVVKNVTGLDMAKLMIGSFGTLAALASVNFKVFPKPAEERTFICWVQSIEPLLKLRKEILQSVLQPVAIDLLNPAAVEQAGLDGRGYALLLEAAGSRPVVDRYERDYSKLASEAGVDQFLALAGTEAEGVWQPVRDFSAAKEGTVLRVSSEPKKIAEIFDLTERAAPGAAVLARAAAGVGFVLCGQAEQAGRCLAAFREAGLVACVESAPVAVKRLLESWADPGEQFEVMQRIKDTLDPHHLLNPGRLFTRI